jgi:hypothetical protein
MVAIGNVKPAMQSLRDARYSTQQCVKRTTRAIKQIANSFSSDLHAYNVRVPVLRRPREYLLF